MFTNLIKHDRIILDQTKIITHLFLGGTYHEQNIAAVTEKP